MNETLQPPQETTGRLISPGAEKWLGKEIPVLDHGSIRLVEYMGNDNLIEAAARVSYGEGTRPASATNTLIRHLRRHGHTSPFEMGEMIFMAKMPILVARQWVRHRTASINEYSARYSIVPDMAYVPAIDAISSQSLDNKQGRAGAVDEDYALEVQKMWTKLSEDSYKLYEYLLNDDGEGNTVDQDRPKLARELARGVLPVDYYTQWYWKCDLHNIFNFLRLRTDPHAQFEIREYANAIAEVVADAFPLSWKAFKDYELDSTRITGPEKDVLLNLLAGSNIKFTVEQVTQVANESGLKNRREIDEFVAKVRGLKLLEEK